MENHLVLVMRGVDYVVNIFVLLFKEVKLMQGTLDELLGGRAITGFHKRFLETSYCTIEVSLRLISFLEIFVVFFQVSSEYV